MYCQDGKNKMSQIDKCTRKTDMQSKEVVAGPIHIDPYHFYNASSMI